MATHSVLLEHATVRNTFLHCEWEDSDAESSDERPPMVQALTEPLGLKDACQLARSKRRLAAKARLLAEDSDSTDCSSPQVDADDAAGPQIVSGPEGQSPLQSPLSALPVDAPCVPQTPCDNRRTSTESGAGQAKRQSPQPNRTTLMLRNLPNKYTRDHLLQLLASHGFFRRVDFVYYPIDFERRAGLGFAFVNTFTPIDAELLRRALDGFCNWSVSSQKVCRVCWREPIQGLEANVARYQNSPLMHAKVPDAYRPLLLDRSGMRVSFPPPTERIKPPLRGVKLV